jgi:hypothetical protein
MVGNVHRGRGALITVRPLTLRLPGFLGNRACPVAFSPKISTRRWAAEWAGGPPRLTRNDETEFNAKRCFDGVF